MDWENIEWIYSLFHEIENPNFETSMKAMSLVIAEMEYDKGTHDLYKMR